MTYQTGVEIESVPRLEHEEQYRFEYDTAETRPSMAVVAGLSRVLDLEPTAFEPLQRTVDTDALDTLLESADSDTLQITFQVPEHTVVISGDGVVTVAPADVDRDNRVYCDS